MQLRGSANACGRAPQWPVPGGHCPSRGGDSGSAVFPLGPTFLHIRPVFQTCSLEATAVSKSDLSRALCHMRQLSHFIYGIDLSTLATAAHAHHCETHVHGISTHRWQLPGSTPHKRAACFPGGGLPPTEVTNRRGIGLHGDPVLALRRWFQERPVDGRMVSCSSPWTVQGWLGPAAARLRKVGGMEEVPRNPRRLARLRQLSGLLRGSRGASRACPLASGRHPLRVGT